MLENSAIRTPHSALVSLQDQLIKQLTTASEHMVYISETDSDVVPFAAARKVEQLTTLTFAAALGMRLPYHIEYRDYDDFLNRVIRNHPKDGWTELKAILDDHLKDRSVFRVGNTRVTYYAVGLFENVPVGVKFSAVET